MFQFVFNNPVKVLFGPGQLQNLHKEKLPGSKALIATSNGTSVSKYGYLDALEKALLFSVARRFSIRDRRYSRNIRKYFIPDPGLLSAGTGYR